MKSPRFLSPRLACALAVGCALLSFAAAPSAQAQIKVVPLSMDKIDKMGKFAQSVEADPAAKAAMEEADKDEDIAKAMTTGESVNGIYDKKYPKAAAVYKKVGITPDEFMAEVVSLSMATTGTSDGTSDAAVAKANIDFYNANKEKVDKVMSDMK